MNNVSLKTVGVVGGVILVLGLLLIASQYVGDLTGGASADVVNYDQLPETISISSEEYRGALDLISQYQTQTDLASKNESITQLRELMSRWGR